MVSRLSLFNGDEGMGTNEQALVLHGPDLGRADIVPRVRTGGVVLHDRDDSALVRSRFSLSSAVEAVLTLRCSLALFTTLIVMWTIQVQALLQIIINRVNRELLPFPFLVFCSLLSLRFSRRGTKLSLVVQYYGRIAAARLV
jgi:hypothetical protein